MSNSLLNEEFKKCLKKFPELKDVELMVKEASELAGAEGWFGCKRVVILYVPEILKNKPKCLAPVIYHELSHIINKEDPDKVFFERADEDSKLLWKHLQRAKAISCKIEEIYGVRKVKGNER